MDQIFIRIPLKRIIAGDYKVGLTPRSDKTAVSLPQLVQETNAFSVKNRPGCTPTLKQSDPKDLFLAYNVKCHLPDSDPSGHDVQVHFDVSKVQQTGKAKDLDVRCSCACPAFLYWGAQWNLHQRDGLEGQPRPALQAPTERLDLRNNFVICKHCKAVFERILPAVQHNVNNIIRGIEVKKKEEEIELKNLPKPTIRRQVKKKPEEEDVEEKLREGLERREREQLLKNQGIVKRSPTPEEEGLAVEEVEAPEEQAAPAPTPTPAEEKPGLPAEDEAYLKWQEKEERGKLLRERNKKRLEEKNKPEKIEEHPNAPHMHKGLPYKVPPKKRSSLLVYHAIR